MTQPNPQPGRKRRGHKTDRAGYMTNFGRFIGRHQSTKRLAARKARREEPKSDD